jgi:hypothetical protein
VIRLIGSWRVLSDPHYDLADQIRVGGLPDERWPPGEAERLALFPTNRGVHADRWEDVQRAWSLSSHKIGIVAHHLGRDTKNIHGDDRD